MPNSYRPPIPPDPDKMCEFCKNFNFDSDNLTCDSCDLDADSCVNPLGTCDEWKADPILCKEYEYIYCNGKRWCKLNDAEISVDSNVKCPCDNWERKEI